MSDLPSSHSEVLVAEMWGPVFLPLWVESKVSGPAEAEGDQGSLCR